MFQVGDKVRVIQGSVIDVVWDMVKDKEGTIVGGDPFPFDYHVIIPNSGRDGDGFAFMENQLRKA